MKRGLEWGNWKKLVEDEARLKGYSPKTIISYLFHIGRFIDSGLEPREYLLEMINKGSRDESVRSAGFAVKFFLRLRGEDIALKELPNVRREKKLPVVLSKKEIEAMIMSTKNLNHRLLIQTAYSAGLRLSEIINLMWEDIDFSRNLIHIKRSKGKKDRVVMLSPKVKKGLRSLDADKQGCVFRSSRGSRYTARSIQVIVRNAAEKAGIKLVYNKCIMMFASPVKGVHAFHRFLARIFGKVPA